MKRKLNASNLPEETPEELRIESAPGNYRPPNNLQGSRVAAPSRPTPNTTVQFSSLGLDARLLQAVAEEKWSAPTQVQSKTIPLSLEGRDLLVRSKTGSGKTAAHALPILQHVLNRRAAGPSQRGTSVLILVPTRELANQTQTMIESLVAFCQGITCVNLTRNEAESVQRARLANFPDIVVATPGRACANITSGAFSLDHIAQLVIDEADLVVSYEGVDDVKTIARLLPTGVQKIMLSATLQTDVEAVRSVLDIDPTVIEVDEKEAEANKITQHVIHCAEIDKWLVIYAIFKLKLVKGKCLVFVHDVERSYRLKLFLEQFGIRSCILNSELPVNSRLSIVDQFNRGLYDIIIASDESEVTLGNEEKRRDRKKGAHAGEAEVTEEQDVPQQEETSATKPNGAIYAHGDALEGKSNNEKPTELVAESSQAVQERPSKRTKGAKGDKYYGVARGIDFQNVAAVVNFDLPTSSKSYTHRIGRTARAGKTGMALSFVVPIDEFHKHKPTSIPSHEHDEKVLAKITKVQEKNGHRVEPYSFDMKKLDGFRYRMIDALRAVTGIAVREARVRELRQELIKSEKLKRHFEENPEELRHLRHDGELRAARVQPHLKHVPDYLLPGGSRNAAQKDIGFVGFSKPEGPRKRIKVHSRAKGKGKTGAKRKANPLQTFRSKQ